MSARVLLFPLTKSRSLPTIEASGDAVFFSFYLTCSWGLVAPAAMSTSLEYVRAAPKPQGSLRNT